MLDLICIVRKSNGFLTERPLDLLYETKSLFGNSFLNMCAKPLELRKVIGLIEKLALLRIDNPGIIRRIEDAIKVADQLKEVNTEGVEPMYTVQESEPLFLRNDETEETDRKLVQQNAMKVIEDYFVAPPGNIPLNVKKKEEDAERVSNS